MTYDEWMSEVENFSTRHERMIEDIATGDTGTIVKWIMAAYDVGYEEGEHDGYDEGYVKHTDNPHLT